MPPPHPKSTLWSKFWTWTTQERPDLERWSALWWREQTLLCTVFAITGSSSLVVVRPVLKKVLGLEGSFKEGPWSYRIISLVLCSPAYTALLLTFGTLAGRHNKFAGMARQMWGRFLTRSMAKDLGCAPAKMKQSVKQSVQQQQGSKKAP